MNSMNQWIDQSKIDQSNIQSNFNVFNDAISGFFYCEYALHELCSMVRSDAFSFTRMVYIRSAESMPFLTFPSFRLDKCIKSWLEKDRNCLETIVETSDWNQKLECGALPSIIFSGRKTTTMAAWQFSESFYAKSLNPRLTDLQLSRNLYWIQRSCENHSKFNFPLTQ